MNRFDDAIRDVLTSAPPRPEIDELETRIRRHRARRGATVAVLVGVVVVVASITAAASLGHGTSRPQVAVSPTTTSSGVTSAACGLGTIEAHEAYYKAQERALNTELLAAERTNAPNRDTIDAEHQAILRQLSDVEYQRLGAESQDLRVCDSTTTTPTTTETAAMWCQQFSSLNRERVRLEVLERDGNERLTAEVASHSRNAGVTDAEHQAVLRRQSDVQQAILRLDENRPNTAC